MKQPKNSNFERMRLEAERRRLGELETQAAALAEQLTAQTEAARKDRADLEAQNAGLREAMSSHGQTGAEQIAELEARCEALSADLSARIEAEARTRADLDDLRADLRNRTETERQSATQLAARYDSLTQRVAQVDESFSEPERLRAAIAPVLSGALRDAGERAPDHLASAIAPHIVNTVKTEIRNSEDELIEAIHPKLGVLIAAAISNAIEELNRKVDEALPVDRWVAALKGRVTGGPSAGWLLEDGTQFVVKEAMLIERKSGMLLAREEALLGPDIEDHAPDEDLVAGMIAALQAFAEEAYGKNGAGNLRRFSFTTDTIYLRASPAKILAVRCTGVGPPEIERRVDDLLIQALERLRDDDRGDEPVLMIADFNTPPEEDDEGVSASGILGRGLGAVAAALIALWGHNAVTDAHQERWFDAVEATARADGTLGPYPLTVERSNADTPIRISGLMPSEDARAALENRLDWLASPARIETDVAVVSIETQ